MTDTDYPSHWSDGARDAWDSTLEQRSDLAGPEFAVLEAACELLAAADAHATVARAAGGVAAGSTGQVVVHPSSIEERHCRSQAAAFLLRLAPAPTSAKLTDSERGRRGAAGRWRAGSA